MENIETFLFYENKYYSQLGNNLFSLACLIIILPFVPTQPPSGSFPVLLNADIINKNTKIKQLLLALC